MSESLLMRAFVDLLVLLVPLVVVLALLRLGIPRVSVFNVGALSWVFMLVLMHYVGRYLGVKRTFLFLSDTTAPLFSDIGIAMLSALVVIALNEVTRVLTRERESTSCPS